MRRFELGSRRGLVRQRGGWRDASEQRGVVKKPYVYVRRFTCHVPAPFVTMESWTHIFCSRRMRLKFQMRRRFTCHVPAPFVTIESWTHIFCSRRMRLPHAHEDGTYPTNSAELRPPGARLAAANWGFARVCVRVTDGCQNAPFVARRGPCPTRLLTPPNVGTIRFWARSPARAHPRVVPSHQHPAQAPLSRTVRRTHGPV